MRLLFWQRDYVLAHAPSSLVKDVFLILSRASPINDWEIRDRFLPEFQPSILYLRYALLWLDVAGIIEELADGTWRLLDSRTRIV